MTRPQYLLVCLITEIILTILYIAAFLWVRGDETWSSGNRVVVVLVWAVSTGIATTVIASLVEWAFAEGEEE